MVFTTPKIETELKKLVLFNPRIKKNSRFGKNNLLSPNVALVF
ncbi:MAG: hypothetical protein ACJAUH_000564 [Saprospiraceae bacterium]|jgi:hypothetical protein|tara:strand:+ start:684 stop:812 length:129 start_codon:yes stop_codon:yes gene_type:complete